MWYRLPKKISNFQQSRCNGPRYCNTIWVDSYCVIVEFVTIVCWNTQKSLRLLRGPLSVNHVSWATREWTISTILRHIVTYSQNVSLTRLSLFNQQKNWDIKTQPNINWGWKRHQNLIKTVRAPSLSKSDKKIGLHWCGK